MTERAKEERRRGKARRKQTERGGRGEERKGDSGEERKGDSREKLGTEDIKGE